MKKDEGYYAFPLLNEQVFLPCGQVVKASYQRSGTFFVWLYGHSNPVRMQYPGGMPPKDWEAVQSNCPSGIYMGDNSISDQADQTIHLVLSPMAVDEVNLEELHYADRNTVTWRIVVTFTKESRCHYHHIHFATRPEADDCWQL